MCVGGRGRPELGFKKPKPDFLNKISVFINQNQIFSFLLRFLINQNRNFERSFRFLINRNRNSGWLPDFQFLIWFVHPLSLCTRYKHACIQNKHIQCIHTYLILLTTAVYEHTSQFICLSFLQYFICLNPVLIDRNRIFKYPSGFLSIGTGILKSHSGFLSTGTGIPAKYRNSGS